MEKAPATAAFSGSTLTLSNPTDASTYYFKVVSGETESAAATFKGWENLTGVGYSVKNSKITGTNANMEYCIDGSTWAACTTGETAVTFAVGNTLSVRDKTTQAHTRTLISQALTAPAAPTYSINYGNETTNEEVRTTDEYKIGDGAWIMATGEKISIEPGKIYYFRTAATDKALTSAEQTLTASARPATPGAVAASNITKTDVSITINPTVKTQQYSVDDGNTWKDGNGSALSFTGLTANTSYDVITRTKATDSAFVSASSTSTNVKTKAAAAAAPAGADLPTVDTATNPDNVGTDKMTIPVKAGYEYYISISNNTPDESAWATGANYYKATADGTYTFTGLTENTAYYIHVRKAATDAEMPSASASVTQKTRPTAPDTAFIGAMVDNSKNTATTINAATKSGYEYILLPKSTGLTEASWKDAIQGTGSDVTFSKDNRDPRQDLTSGTEYTMYVRKSATGDTLASPTASADTYTLPATPAPGIGYTVDYSGETIKPDSGYEVRKKPDGTWSTALVTPFEPGAEYEVRKKAASPIPASAPVAFTPAARPATPAAVAAGAISKTDTAITINPTVAGQEYIVVPAGTANPVWTNAKEGGSALTFDGLTPGTAYQVLTRVKATGTAPVSLAGTATDVTTKTASAAAPTGIEVDNAFDPTQAKTNVVPVHTADGYEYVLLPKGETPTDADWANAKTSADGNPVNFEKDAHERAVTSGTEYTVHIRKKGTDTAMPSAAATKDAYTLQTAPAAGEGYTIDYETEKITVPAGYEVSTDPNFASSGAVASGATVTPGTTYYVRKVQGTNPAPSAAVSFTMAARPSLPASVVKTDETVKDKGDGKISGITPALEYSTDGGTTWTSGTGAELPLAVGASVQVRVKATGTAPHSDATTYTGAASTTTLTVTFDAQGGSAVAAQTGLAYNAKATKPTDKPTRNGYFFLGWYEDAACRVGWDFAAHTVVQNTILYAKWVSVAFTVGGAVQDGDGNVVVGATVTIKQGNTQFAVGKTNNAGEYSFDSIAPGTYNIVVTSGGKTMTVLVTVTQNTTVKTIILPTANVNSQVIIQPGTPDIVVGELDTEAVAKKQDGQIVTLTLTVGQKTADTAANASAIIAVAGGKTLQYLQIDLHEKVGTGAEQPVTETDNLLTLRIPFDTTQKEFTIYRYHAGNVDTLTTTPNADGEYISVEEGYIVLHVKKFSTYAVSYTVVAPSNNDSATGSGTGSDTSTTGGTTAAAAGFRSPRTGDASQLMLWKLIFALALCGMGMFGYAYYRKRKKNQ